MQSARGSIAALRGARRPATVGVVSEHPVVMLRDRLTAEFSDHLPRGVHPIPGWCAEPQFFPGASGLLTARTWDEVIPASESPEDDLPPVPVRGVMVVDSYQWTLTSYEQLLAGDVGGLSTWLVLRQILASVKPTEVFLTNAFIGLPDVARDTAPFPTTRAFSKRCAQFLAYAIEVIRPRCVVCLGLPAAKMLASVTPGLAPWRSWPGYGRLGDGGQLILDGEVEGVAFRAVAVRHPSRPRSTGGHHDDSLLISAASAI